MRLTAASYREVRARLATLGYSGDWEWSQNVGPPADEVALVQEYAWVVLNSGMRHTVARAIMDRVWPLLSSEMAIGAAFGHRGKVAALLDTWSRRHQRLAEFQAAPDPVAWCETLPWIGPITKWHLAKNLGVDCAKPDRWLVRLAAIEDETVDELCRRIAENTGDRVATVDVVLWRACACGLLRVEGRELRFGEGAPA